MIQLKLSFGKEDAVQKFDIVKDELLSSALDRALKEVPKIGYEIGEMFLVVVNGHVIEKDFWDKIKLQEKDNIIISPKIRGGQSGQIFKQIVIIAAIVIAQQYELAPYLVAGIAIGTTLLMNALIPPPVPELGGIGGLGDIDNSQMYTISGQSNQAKRLGSVPKVYGSHRIFPNLAVAPYTELAVSGGDYARRVIEGNLSFSARNPGTEGNAITLKFINGATAGNEVVSVSGKEISITYPVGVSTAAQVLTKLQASAAAMALVSVSILNDVSTVLTFQDGSTLFGGEVAGETVQYMYSIYDFGLGTNKIADLKVGDTPLTTESFKDFDYRYVDPAKSDIDEDEFDGFLFKDFKYYRSKRTITQLTLNMVDGQEIIQFSDVNPDLDPQEIVLDFVCPRGLFGYSSQGSTGQRQILMNIDFKKVGTTEWRPYNDLDYVDNYSSVGGNDYTNINVNFAPDPAFVNSSSPSDYYEQYNWYYSGGTYTGPTGFGSQNNVRCAVQIKKKTKKLLVVDDGRMFVGAKVFYRDDFLGIISAINDKPGNLTELVLDRELTQRTCYFCFSYYGSRTVGTGIHAVQILANPGDFRAIRTSQHSDSVAIMYGQRQSAVYGNFKFSPKEPGQYEVRVKRINASGEFTTQVGDDITWGGMTTAFKRSPVNTDKRHVFLELRIKATNQLNGNIQNLSAVASSVLPVYDPDTATWTRQVTNNPAWVFVDLLTGPVNKRAIPVSRLHMPSILEWADFCDAVPTPPPSQDFIEPRFQCNFILDYDTTLQGVLQQIGSAAQASLNIIDGKYGVLIDREQNTPVQIFTPRNSRDFSSTRFYGPRPHGVKVKYIDPNLAWELSETVVYDNGYNEETATEFDDLTSFACTNHEQAWRFGRYMIAQNRLRQETISLIVDFEILVCTRGDYVQLTQDVMRAGGTPARVKSFVGDTIVIDDSLDIIPDIDYGYVYRNSDTGEILTSTLTVTDASTFVVDGAVPGVGDLIVIGEVGRLVFDCIIKSITPNDDMSANLTLIEKASAIYDYESSDVLPTYDPQISATSNPESFPPKAVLDLVVADNFWECSQTQSGYSYYVDISWSIPAGSVYEFFEIWVNDGRGYKVVATTTSKIYHYIVDQTRLGIDHGFKVVAVSASGKKLQLIAMPEVIVTPVVKSTPPSDVSNLNMSITNQILQLSWDSIDDCDVAQYSIRFSPDVNDNWESSIPLATVSKNVNSVSPQARTGVYLIKAVDYGGNQSATATVGITTIPNLFDLNIIETLNDAPTFTGTLEQTDKLGDSIILQEAVPGDVDTIQYYPDGFYYADNLLDLDDVYTVRLQSQIRADGYKFGELMSDWEHLSDIDHLNTSTSDDWDVAVEYRATDVFAAMSDWVRLDLVDHINYGAGIGFTDWRPIPTIGDATGRVFAFRIKLKSFTPNVTPRLFDGSIKADMPDRTDSFENLVSSASLATVVTYEQVFKGPGLTPNVQISVDNGQSGDYWSFDSKTLEGFSIRFYDVNDVQVSRQFDVVAKGYGRRHTTTI